MGNNVVHRAGVKHNLSKEVEGGEVSEALAAPLFEVHLRDMLVHPHDSLMHININKFTNMYVYM